MKFSSLTACPDHFLILPSYKSLPPSFFTKSHNLFSPIFCNFNKNSLTPKNILKQNTKVNAKGKDNVWSVDNDIVEDEKKKKNNKKRKEKRGKPVKSVGKKESNGRIIVSAAMLMEIETVLQTQEPVIRPAWNTFASSVSGIWSGVGAVFSPITAEMEPVDVGTKNEYLYDCYTLSYIEAVPSPSGGPTSHVQRKINWVTFNPRGEMHIQNRGGSKSVKNHVLPRYESFDFETADVMEEDFMGVEPGLVFFEDGSYSRGPVEIPVGKVEETHISPTFKFEQCLVKGCHKRLRIVHTIEFNNGGSDIQIMRVAVNEEQWVSPANLHDQSNLEFDVKPFSQRKRIQPSELTGPWKVFEVSATPIYGEDMVTEESNGTPCVYLCTETLKKRSAPENPVYFEEEEMLDTQDASILWLSGGVTAYVDVSEDGILCIGVGWYSDEGINLVMERDYGMDGKLKEVRSKSELKRRCHLAMDKHGWFQDLGGEASKSYNNERIELFQQIGSTRLPYVFMLRTYHSSEQPVIRQTQDVHTQVLLSVF